MTIQHRVSTIADATVDSRIHGKKEAATAKNRLRTIVTDGAVKPTSRTSDGPTAVNLFDLDAAIRLVVIAAFADRISAKERHVVAGSLDRGNPWGCAADFDSAVRNHAAAGWWLFLVAVNAPTGSGWMVRLARPNDLDPINAVAIAPGSVEGASLWWREPTAVVGVDIGKAIAPVLTLFRQPADD